MCLEQVLSIREVEGLMWEDCSQCVSLRQFLSNDQVSYKNGRKFGSLKALI